MKIIDNVVFVVTAVFLLFVLNVFLVLIVVIGTIASVNVEDDGTLSGKPKVLGDHLIPVFKSLGVYRQDQVSLLLLSLQMIEHNHK